jgi:glycosyltransferase involved in cell wall biosynthesis
MSDPQTPDPGPGVLEAVQSQRPPTVAAVIIARDEESNISACLNSVGWADQLCVLLDARTADRTEERARAAGAEVARREFVNFADQRNAALERFEADWILFVDADERGTPDLGSEVRWAIGEPGRVGWWVPRRNYIWGRWIRHAGWYPDYQLRLLKRGWAHYDPTREVHEVVVLDGEEGYLEHPLIHYNYATVAEFLRRQDYYASYEARVLLQRGARPRLHSLVVQPLREFIRRYWTLEGFKDGASGLALSALMSYYTFIAYRRARNLWARAADAD